MRGAGLAEIGESIRGGLGEIDDEKQQCGQRHWNGERAPGRVAECVLRGLANDHGDKRTQWRVDGGGDENAGHAHRLRKEQAPGCAAGFRPIGGFGERGLPGGWLAWQVPRPGFHARIDSHSCLSYKKRLPSFARIIRKERQP